MRLPMRNRLFPGSRTVHDPRMRIAIVTLEGFNELDSFIASAMINRVKQPELKALMQAERAA